MAFKKGQQPANGFKKGESGNPGGRPKGLAALIREKTRDGRVIVDYMLRVLDGKEPGAKPSDKLTAAKFLAEHGFGRPIQPMKHSGSLTLEELVSGASGDEADE